jgi:hypothetical protein
MFKIIHLYLTNFKKKWAIESNWQIFKIMVVFALAGQTILFSMPLIKDLFNVTNDLNIFFKVLFLIFFSFPLYQIYLIIWSFFLGEHKFFIRFIKKTLKKLADLLLLTTK